MSLLYVDFVAKLKVRGLSKRRFGILSGTPPSSVSRWKHGARGVPPWVESWLTMYAAVERQNAMLHTQGRVVLGQEKKQRESDRQTLMQLLQTDVGRAFLERRIAEEIAKREQLAKV